MSGNVNLFTATNVYNQSQTRIHPTVTSLKAQTCEYLNKIAKVCLMNIYSPLRCRASEYSVSGVFEKSSFYSILNHRKILIFATDYKKKIIKQDIRARGDESYFRGPVVWRIVRPS